MTAQDKERLIKKAVKITLIAGGSIGVVYAASKAVQKIRRNKALKDVITNSNSSAATLLRMAINPSGASWMSSFDGTDEIALIEASKAITDFNKVQKYYKDIYASDLIADLQSELSIQDYNKFINTIKNKDLIIDENTGEEIVSTYLYNIGDFVTKNQFSPVSLMQNAGENNIEIDTIYFYPSLEIIDRDIYTINVPEGNNIVENWYLVMLGDGGTGWIGETKIELLNSL